MMRFLGSHSGVDIQVFWDVAKCRLVSGYRRFEIHSIFAFSSTASLSPVLKSLHRVEGVTVLQKVCYLSIQWRDQEFFFGGGIQQIQLRIEVRESGDLGVVAP
jgi:hypothetical protein